MHCVCCLLSWCWGVGEKSQAFPVVSRRAVEVRSIRCAPCGPQVISQSFTFILAGYETTANVLTQAVFHISQVKQRLQALKLHKPHSVCILMSWCPVLDSWTAREAFMHRR